MQEKRNILKMTSLVMIVVIAAKALGLIKQMVISATFGTSLETDIILLSQDFISNIQYILAQMILTAFTAIYIHLKNERLSTVNIFIRDVIKLFLLIGIIAIVFSICLASVIAKVIAPTYTTKNLLLLTNYLRIYAFTLIPSILIAIFGALLNANDRYVVNESSTLIQNLIIIVIVLIGGHSVGINVLIYSTFAYSIFNMIYLGLMSKRYFGKVIIPKKNKWYQSKNIKSLLNMLGPLLIGYSMIFVNEQIDKMLVSGMKEGTVTALSYGSSLSNLVTTLLVSVCTIFFTRITTYIATKDNKIINSMLCNSVGMILTVLIPVSIITVVLAEDIVSIVFLRGAFNYESVKMTAAALMGYGFCFLPFAVKNIFSRFQYGNETTKWPMIVSLIGIFINIVLSIILSSFLGVFGITLATSISEVVSAVLIVFITIRNYSSLSLHSLKNYIFCWIGGGAACLFLCIICKNYLRVSYSIIKVGITAMISFIVYCLIVFPKIKTILKK